MQVQTVNSQLQLSTKKGIYGSRIYLHLFFTSALDGGEQSTSHPGILPPEKKQSLLIEKKAEWAPQPVWTFRRRKLSLVLPENQTLNRPAYSLECKPTMLSRCPKQWLFVCDHSVSYSMDFCYIQFQHPQQCTLC